MNVERISNYFDNLEGQITLGIDGFVDEVWQVLSKRTNRTDYKLFDKMRDFAKSVHDCGEGGYANEIIRKRRSYGGFTANTGKAVGKLGGNPTLIGMFGKESVDQVFREFQETYVAISVADPAICQIFEFTDGKLMLPYIEETMDFNWSTLIAALPDKKLAKALDADIVAIGYWSQIPAFDDLIVKLCENYLITGRCRRMFFDFADIRKRDQQSLEHTLKILADLNPQMPMTLSLNEHEAALLFSYYGRNFNWEKSENAEKDVDYVRQRTGLDELIVHTPYFAVASTINEGTAIVLQQYCKNPIITTGAGDNFNGGYLAASLGQGQLSLEERLFVGNATTGFYIKNGYSPNKVDLISEMRSN